MNSYRKQADLLKAMAHPIRLRILEIISAEESCVCHITAILNKSQPYVSQQLMILREAGLVSYRRDGTMVHYRPADERIAETIALSRALLGPMDLDYDLVPRSPVAGCPCPKCENTRPRAQCRGED